jgi:hypothetical protein
MKFRRTRRIRLTSGHQKKMGGPKYTTKTKKHTSRRNKAGGETKEYKLQVSCNKYYEAREISYIMNNSPHSINPDTFALFRFRVYIPSTKPNPNSCCEFFVFITKEKGPYIKVIKPVQVLPVQKPATFFVKRLSNDFDPNFVESDDKVEVVLKEYFKEISDVIAFLKKIKKDYEHMKNGIPSKELNLPNENLSKKQIKINDEKTLPNAKETLAQHVIDFINLPNDKLNNIFGAAIQFASENKEKWAKSTSKYQEKAKKDKQEFVKKELVIDELKPGDLEPDNDTGYLQNSWDEIELCRKRTKYNRRVWLNI